MITRNRSLPFFFTLSAIFAMALSGSGAAQDQAVTTRELYSDCSTIQPDGSFDEKDRGKALYCNGYLRGTWEGLQEMAFCSGEMVDIGWLRQAFRRMVDENPKSMDKPAAWAVYAAFKIAHPCAANVPDRPTRKKPPATTM